MKRPGKASLLLVANGLVLASHTLLAKAANGFGVSPVLYAWASAAGAAAVLAAYRIAAGSWRLPSRRVLTFGLIAGLISIALPQVMIYSASAFVSAGIASLAYAFPTPLTYLLASVFGLERPTLGRSVGIGLAFVGASLLAFTRASTLAGDGYWIALAMLAPVALAAGNIYRAQFWPPGSAPVELAFVMSAAAAGWLLAGMAVISFGTGSLIASLQPSGTLFLLAASALAAFGNVIYFELQRAGGIVSFSQIGYVGAILGLLGGTAILGERYSTTTWAAALVIGSGVLVSEAFRPRPPPPEPAETAQPGVQNGSSRAKRR